MAQHNDVGHDQVDTLSPEQLSALIATSNTDPDACHRLASFFLTSHQETPEDVDALASGLKYALRGAEKDHAPSMVMASHIYEAMAHTPETANQHALRQQAADWAYKAAIKGDPMGQIMAITNMIDTRQATSAFLLADQALKNPNMDEAGKSMIGEMLGEMFTDNTMRAHFMREVMKPQIVEASRQLGHRINGTTPDSTIRGTQPLPSGQEPDAGCP